MSGQAQVLESGQDALILPWNAVKALRGAQQKANQKRKESDGIMNRLFQDAKFREAGQEALRRHLSSPASAPKQARTGELASILVQTAVADLVRVFGVFRTVFRVT